MDWPFSKDEEAALTKQALAVREKAYAPYSRFRVGAVLIAADGSKHMGCNVENVSYGLCVCAERTALGSAIASGHKKFLGVIVATGSSPPSPPCGMCRQSLDEFVEDDLAVMAINPEGEVTRTFLSEIFPAGFDRKLLDTGRDKVRRSDDSEDSED